MVKKYTNVTFLSILDRYDYYKASYDTNITVVSFHDPGIKNFNFSHEMTMFSCQLTLWEPLYEKWS